MAKASEFHLLAVNGVPVAAADALACVDALFDEPDLLRSLVDACLNGQALEEQPVEVSRALEGAALSAGHADVAGRALALAGALRRAHR